MAGVILAKVGLAGFLAAALLAETAVPKLDFRTCKSKIMQDPRYLTGAAHSVCGDRCAAAIKRCMASGGKID